MNYEQARARVKLEREMDDDFEIIRSCIERAYSTDYDDEFYHSYLDNAGKEDLFQAFLRLSRRLKALEDKQNVGENDKVIAVFHHQRQNI